MRWFFMHLFVLCLIATPALPRPLTILAGGVYSISSGKSGKFSVVIGHVFLAEAGYRMWQSH